MAERKLATRNTFVRVMPNCPGEKCYYKKRIYEVGDVFEVPKGYPLERWMKDVTDQVLASRKPSAQPEAKKQPDAGKK